MLVHQMDKLTDFHSYLKKNPAEVAALYQDLLINVTEFFRNPEVFEFLASEVFPKIIKDRPADQPIRLWASGCSSGEEAYSLAIALLEFLGENTVNTRIQLFGTDLSEPAIDLARAGFYPESSRGGGFTGAPAAVFLQGRRRISNQQGDSGDVCFRTSQHLRRPAIFPHGPDQLPQRTDLYGRGPAKTSHAGLPLRAQSERHSDVGKLGRHWQIFESLRGRR